MSKTNDSTINKNLTEIIVDLINHLDQNKEITPEETDEILISILNTLKSLSQKGTSIDIERIKRASNKIKN